MWRIGLRACVALIPAIALAGCVTDSVGLTSPAANASAAAPSPGAWKFDQRVDRATGKSVGKAYVVTTRVTIRSGRIFPKPAGLQLECFKDKPVVLIKFTQRVGSNRSASMSYRFDEKTPHSATIRFLPDQKSFVIEDPAAIRQFVEELNTANMLYVTVDSLVDGATRAEFPVQSAGPAIEAGFEGCPLSPQQNA